MDGALLFPSAYPGSLETSNPLEILPSPFRTQTDAISVVWPSVRGIWNTSVENTTHGEEAEDAEFWPPNTTSVMPIHPVLFPALVQWTFTLLLTTLFLVGVLGNALVIIVVARTRELKSSTNLLLVNLAGADLLVLMVPLPTALTELHSRPETWILGAEMCKAVPFVEWTVSHASVLTILVISSERYYAICRPLRASYTCTRMRAFSCIAYIWVGAIFVSFPILLMSKHAYVHYKVDSSIVPTCFTEMSSTWALSYYTSMVVMFFFFPLVLLMVLYLLIGKRLMRESHGEPVQTRAELPNMKARKQVVVMLATVTVFFFVCLLPFRVFSLYIIWDDKQGEHLGPTSYYSILYATRVMLYLNSAINPILYSLTSSKFREAFLKLLRGNSRKVLSRNSTFTTTGTSHSNGRSASSRSFIVDGYCRSQFDNYRSRGMLRCGHHPSLDIHCRENKGFCIYGSHGPYNGWNRCHHLSFDNERHRPGSYNVCDNQTQDSRAMFQAFKRKPEARLAEEQLIMPEIQYRCNDRQVVRNSRLCDSMKEQLMTARNKNEVSSRKGITIFRTTKNDMYLSDKDCSKCNTDNNQNSTRDKDKRISQIVPDNTSLCYLNPPLMSSV